MPLPTPADSGSERHAEPPGTSIYILANFGLFLSISAAFQIFIQKLVFFIALILFENLLQVSKIPYLAEIYRRELLTIFACLRHVYVIWLKLLLFLIVNIIIAETHSNDRTDGT